MRGKCVVYVCEFKHSFFFYLFFFGVWVCDLVLSGRDGGVCVVRCGVWRV